MSYTVTRSVMQDLYGIFSSLSNFVTMCVEYCLAIKVSTCNPPPQKRISTQHVQTCMSGQLTPGAIAATTASCASSTALYTSACCCVNLPLAGHVQVMSVCRTVQGAGHTRGQQNGTVAWCEGCFGAWLGYTPGQMQGYCRWSRSRKERKSDCIVHTLSTRTYACPVTYLELLLYQQGAAGRMQHKSKGLSHHSLDSPEPYL
jgi:hypothetical protein